MQKSQIMINFPETIWEYARLQELRSKSIIEDENLWNLLFSIEEYKPATVEDSWNNKTYKDWYILECWSKMLWFCKISQRFPVWYKRVNHNFILGPMYVASEFRWQWYWKLLLKGSLERLAKSNKNIPSINICLWVKENNYSAIKLYESQKFEIIWKEKWYMQFQHKYIDCLIMQLIIKNV
jgi:GNAT superfamily N-acetyltransferase